MTTRNDKRSLKRPNPMMWRQQLWKLAFMSSRIISGSSSVRQTNSSTRYRLGRSSASWMNKFSSQQSYLQEEDEDRNLKSSDSRDHDDYWRRPADYDDYITGDDDFYSFNEDPIPPSLFPLDIRSVVGFFLASFGVVLGASGGIGGGGIVVPVFIIVSGLSPRAAIPLGSVTVLGGSLAGLLTNLKQRHPLADRPIIDWDLILVMEPVVLVGALIGSVLHRIVSEKILMVLLVLLLSVAAHTTLTKAKRMYEAENKYIEHLRAARYDYMSRVGSWGSAVAVPPANVSPTKTPTIFDSIPSPNQTMTFESEAEMMAADEKQRILIINPDFVTLRSDLIDQERITPRSKIIVLLAKFAVLIFLNIMLGGGAYRSPFGIICGSVAYWVVQIIMVAFLLASAWAAQTYLINQYELKEMVRFDYVVGDIKWDVRTAIIYPFLFMISGVCAGMFGIGGGMICVPVMLAMGVHPAVVTATASAMIFFSTALSATSYAIFNLIVWDYACVCFFVGFFASMTGQAVMKRARSADGHSNFERNSFIAYCIGGVIMISALLMTMQYVLHIVTYDKESQSYEGGLCEGYRI